jgi:GTPase SAR1 family protein
MLPSELEELIEQAAREEWEELDLSRKGIEVLPAAISNCTNLKKLFLWSNSLSEIPDSITRLTNLQSLNLSHTSLSEIPDSITGLTNLQSLDLSYNSLSAIPDSIAGLTNLQSLDLSYNSLSAIPYSIERLTNLQSLDLSYNSLSEIPVWITRLQKLTRLNLDKNPIAEPPLEVVQKGISAIRTYFQQLETEGVDYLYEAKLLIVGEGGAGKTSLANKIINADYKLCEEDSTKGIEVLHWSFPCTDGNQFHVNIWDFGGQEIYHSTHQFFLTKRSLYLLVADTRKADTDFYYWLNVITLFGDNSPILIVKNEKQDVHQGIDINQLRGEFENIKGVFTTNLASNRNLYKILSECQHQLSQLPQIGQTLPKTWVKVRQALENDPRNYISLNEYLQICKDNGFKERKSALQLSEYLHELGICLHFQDDEMSPLYQTVILKPKWGTDAAYAVLDNLQVIHNFGRFSDKELSQIWSTDEYTGMRSGLLELMKKFQLCYEIPQEKGSYIAPQLLTKNQPKYAWDDTDNLILTYTYDFMPKGILCQFIGAMHQYIEDLKVWRKGVIIKHNFSNTRAEVIENHSKREIRIRIAGENKRDLLAIIIYELTKIHDHYTRLKVVANPPVEVALKGIDAIREYSQQLELEGEERVYEAKLLIIGEGGAGKTTLAKKIINPDYKLCEEDPTKGIEVILWSFKLPNGSIFKVRIWDFSGQEINHATHQYFLTKRSLYILLADNRKEDTDFYYWLNAVDLRSESSPILIVKNEKHGLKREINTSQLKSEFNIKDTLVTNLANNQGLEKILETLQIHLTQLPHIGSVLPKPWVKIRNVLELIPSNYISLDEYLQICKDNDVKQRNDALQLSGYLHDIGICLHFQDKPLLNKTVILKPTWGTNAAYAILDNPKIIDNFGCFQREDLDQIWKSEEYENMHEELLQLMMEFQLCYEISHAKDTYIAPQLLTESQPKYAWDATNNLILRYTYNFMPKGMIRQFIVAMHKYIEKDQENKQIVWRSGVIIHHREYANTRAEVIENYGKREIKIRVSGKNKRDLLTVVTYKLDEIHNAYKRLADKYQKLIPCNCNACKGSQNPHFYEFANLKRRYANHKYTVECDISYEDVNVLSLIDDVGEKSNLYARDEDKQYNREQNNPLPVNVNITNTFNPEQNMSSSQPNSSFNAPVGQVIIGTQTVAGDNIGIQNNNYSPNLSQAAKEIKELLDELSEEYNPNTEKGQNLIKDEAVKAIKENPKLQDRILKALKEGSVTALEEAINHPVAKILISTTKGFLEG